METNPYEATEITCFYLERSRSAAALLLGGASPQLLTNVSDRNRACSLQLPKESRLFELHSRASLAPPKTCRALQLRMAQFRRAPFRCRSEELNIVTPSSNPRVTVKAFDRATTIDLKAVCVNSSKFTQDLEADRLVAAFLYQNGFLKKYLRIAAALDPAGPFVNCLEDATGKSFNELQPMWKNFLVGAHGITLEGARRTK